MQFSSPPANSSHDSGPTSIVSLLVGFAKILGKIFSLFAAAAQIVIFWVAIVSLVLLLIAALMLFTGRGLEAQAGWARATGMLIGTLFFLISLLAVLSLRPGVMSGFFLTTGGMSGYVLWTLWFRFF